MKKYRLMMAMLITFAVTGCRNGRNHVVDELNHTREERLILTEYDTDIEVFIDSAPFVAGHTGDILAHFSLLKNFKPLGEGSVTISLIVGEEVIQQTLEEPTETGIYRFLLQPPKAGTGRLVFDIRQRDGVSQIIVPDITVYDNEHEANEAATAAKVSSSNGVVFTKEQSWKIDFATAEACREPFGQIIHTTAQIQLSQGDERIIIAKTSGVALIPAVNLVEGQAVAAGQTLFSIDASDMADNNLSVRYAENEGEYLRAKAEYERKTALAAENIISQSELMRAKTEFMSAEASYNNLHKNFTAGSQLISAPISGFVTRISVRNGEYVEAGQPVLVVSQNRDLLIKAELQPRYYELLSDITSANIRLLNSNRIYTLDELNGRILSYGKSIDITNPLIPVIFQINNVARFLPGGFVEMFIITQTNTQAITIPNSAMIEEMGNYFIYVQLTPELFEKRAIIKGVTDGLRTAITEGISEGERVVSKGAMFVKLSQVSGELDTHSGHAH